MTTISDALISRSRRAYLGAGRLRAAVDALVANDPPRALVVGPSGAGKSPLLGDIRDALIAAGADIHEPGEPLAALADDDVLLVDDLHHLDAATLEQVLERAANPRAGLVVASRPGLRAPDAREVTRLLGSTGATLVLGLVTRADVHDHVERSGGTIQPTCVEHILAVTAGATRLVADALDLHDERNCGTDGHHATLERALAEVVVARLETLPASLRDVIELACLTPATLYLPLLDGEEAQELRRQAHAAGLLLVDGVPAPIVRGAVRHALPLQRIVDLGVAVAREATVAPGGEDLLRTWLLSIDDPRVAAGLLARAQSGGSGESLPEAVTRAISATGAQARDLLVRQARAAWAAADLDAASTQAEAALALPAPGLRDDAVEVASAVWSARAMMATASDLHAALPPGGASARVRAALAHAGAGRPSRLAGADDVPDAPDGGGAPSTLAIALRQLEEGLRASLAGHPPGTALTRLVRASALYTSSGCQEPIPELPAVVAATVAVGTGQPGIAQRVLEDALAGAQGGPWAARRLQVWVAWLAVQANDPARARAALAQAEAIPAAWSARDELVRQSVVIALALRHGDPPTLEAAWLQGRDRLRQVDIDLYTIAPLAVLVSSVARLGDAETLAPHLEQGLAILDALGSPPLWSVHLGWAGVQQAIQLNRPDHLAPHARLLVAASPHNPLAEAMAHAGGVWANVLAGRVDPDLTEQAARRLGGLGLAWDGARLASHGARAVEDRRISARLLACARELHAREEAAPTPPEADAPTPVAGLAPEGMLSRRERDVAVLVLQGKTYAEIGEQIYISPKTVEHHVAHMRRRLSATNRSDLLAKLRVAIAVTTATGEAAR